MAFGRIALVAALVGATLLAAGCVLEPQRKLRALPADANGSLTIWWSDGQKKEVGSYRNGQPHGFIRRWHQDGSLAFEGRYEGGVPVGEVTHFHLGGARFRSEVVQDGRLHGARRDFHPNGTPATELTFALGLREGLETRWHENGQLSAQGRWGAGLPVGRWRFWDASGRLLREEYSWVSGGRQVGRLVSELAEDGGVTLQERLVLAGEVWSGWRTYWHPDGRQAGLEEWVGGGRNGRDVSWSAAGRMVAEGRRRNDEREGIWTFFDAEGRVARRVRYEAGKEVEELPPEVGAE